MSERVEGSEVRLTTGAHKSLARGTMECIEVLPAGPGWYCWSASIQERLALAAV